MIEVLQGFPDQVAAYACSGHLTKADYKKILADVEDRYSRHKKLRCYTEVANDFNGLDPGALGKTQSWALLTCSTGTVSRWSPTWNG